MTISDKEFGKMMGHVESTHEIVGELKDDFKEHKEKTEDRFDEHGVRLTKIEERNKMVNKGFFSVISGGGIGGIVYGAWKFFF